MSLSRIGLAALIALFIPVIEMPPRSHFQANLGVSKVLALSADARKAEADQLLQQGIEQAQNKQYEAALQSSQQALAIYKEIGDRLGEGRALTLVGGAYIGLGDLPRAIEYLQQSLALASSINDQELESLAQEFLSIAQSQNNPRKAEADQLFEQGFQQFQTSQFEPALQSMQQALTIYREIKDRIGEGAALGGLGVVYDSLGDYPKAIAFHQQSLAIAREIKDRIQEGQSLGNLGATYLALGDYPKAISFLQQTLAIAQEIKDRIREGQSLGNLGLVYYTLGDYPKAISFFHQRLAVAREIKDRKGEGAVLGNLGNAYLSLGDYPKAIEFQQQSLAIAREIKNRIGEGASLANLGLAYYSLGDYPKAIEFQQQSLAIFREIKNRQGEGDSLGNIGIAYYSLGDYPKAIEFQQQSLAIAREIKDRKGEGQSLGILGNVYRSLGDYPKAIEFQQQSLVIAREIKDRKGEGAALLSLGDVYYSLQDYPKAIEFQQQSLAIAREIKDRNGEGKALLSLGVAYSSLGDYPKAIEFFQQSLTIAREIKDRDGEGSALNNLGAALFSEGNLTAAETTLNNAIEVLESLRGGLKDSEKVSIIDTQFRSYRTLQQVLIAQNKTDVALEISERGRARAFVELLAQRLSPNPQLPLPDTFLKPTISAIKQIAKTQNSTIVQYSIISDDFKEQGKEQWKESELYIWVIKPTGEVTFRKADLKPLWQQHNTSLAELVFTSRDSIGVRGLPIVTVRPRKGVQHRQQANLNQQLQQLHQILIEPIADLLPTDPNEKVIFIPQSSLFLAPFPALKDKAGKYLIEKHTILTAPSIQVLELTHQQRIKRGGDGESGKGGVLVVGNPTMPSVRPAFDQPPEQLPSLPGAEREANAIAPLFNTQPFIGSQATKATIVQKMPSARIIHLATHGLLDDIRGLGSAIALAPSANDNGLLTAEEILDLKLNASLVVLSACNTGRGRITGDGIIGLSRSLISAGVPSVIVSLWAVPDSPTAFLMTEFYNQLKQNSNKAQALRQAMLITMKQHPDPKDWAAFTLIGEAE